MSVAFNSKTIIFSQKWPEIESVIQKLNHVLDEQAQISAKSSMVEEQVEPPKFFLTSTEYSNTYTQIYNLCLNKEHNNANSGQLYEAYKKQIHIFAKDKIYSQIKGLKGEDLLKAVTKKWDMYKIFLRLMTNLFSYLDRSHINQNNLQTLAFLGNYIYLKQVHENLKDTIITAFQEEISNDRDNFKADLGLLRRVSEIFAEINRNESKDPNDTYLQLGKAITEHARVYYFMQFQSWSETMSCEDYVNHALDLHAREKVRFEKCLSKFADTYKKISEIFYEEMVKKYKPILLSKEFGFSYMLENKKLDILANVYKMFNEPKDNFEGIRQTFGDWVMKNGNNIFNQKIKQILDETPEQKKKKKFATDNDFVERIFEEYRLTSSIIMTTFQNDPHFQMSFKSALNYFLNVTIEDYGLPELLANYTDFTLRRSNLSHEELDRKLEQVIEIFNHLTEKDIYLTLFQQQLAQRLLSSDSAGGSKYDDESLMITKIKSCCGQGQETKNFEGMINDIKLTVDVKRGFAEHVAHNNIKIVDVFVKVLQEANWPAYKSLGIHLPASAEQVKHEFQTYYAGIKRNQKLRWIDTLGSFEIKLNVSSEKNFLVTVSPIQLMILSQFEKGDEWVPGKFLLEQIGLKPENQPDFHIEMVQLVVKRILISSKLKGEEAKQGTLDEEHFRFNTEFTYKMKKFSTIQDSAIQKFKRDVVNESREHAVEATIVRVMKSRKTMMFNELVQEVHSLMRKFQTSLQQIKKRIESLVEREYIERDKTDLNVYHYKS